MINIVKESDCCGCGACSVVCPRGCITMKEGTLGHLFPAADAKKCVDCGLCDKVCPMIPGLSPSAGVPSSDAALSEGSSAAASFAEISSAEVPYDETFPAGTPSADQRVFAAYAKDGDIRFSGSSGGLFGIFARKALLSGYTVYGAAFDKDMKLRCTSADSVDSLAPLYKSKYLQSDLTGSYKEIRDRLAAGQGVMFVSTPCQVAALRKYLGREYPNLLTVDFFCHGVPSQAFFDDCLAVDGRRFGGKVKGYEFRTKRKHGSTPHYFTEIYEKDGTEKRVSDYYFGSPFYAVFQKYIDLRESCYNCRFAGRERFSDITVGDFHDIDRYINGIDRFDGVSTVVVNSPKGRAFWELCKEDTVHFPMDVERLIGDGVIFGSGTERPSGRDEFIKDSRELDTEELLKKWVDPGSYKTKRLYYSLPSPIRKCLKKALGGMSL